MAIHALKAHLDDKFGIKDIGALHCFLVIEVSRSDSGIVLCQHEFAEDLLIESGIDKSQHTVTPLPVHLNLSHNDGD